MFFNVLPPDSEAALFIGSTSGARFEGDLPKTGHYRIRVFLLRAAARRDETAQYRLDIRLAGGADASSASNRGDFADGFAGGPDSWEVAGLARGDTLNVRATPAPQASAVSELEEGAVVRNLGCKPVDGQRWCHVASMEDRHIKGWVAGRYLREASYQP